MLQSKIEQGDLNNMKLKYTLKRMNNEMFLYCIKKELTYKIDEYALRILKLIKENVANEMTIEELYATFETKGTEEMTRFINNVAVLIKLGVIEINEEKKVTEFNIINFNEVNMDESISIEDGYTRPEVVYWIFTNLCNLHCAHCCWENHYNSNDELEENEVLDIIDQIANMNVSKISFSGGEPTTKYEKLLKAIKYSKDRGINSICIATNALLLNEKKIKELTDAGLTEIQISIDGYKEEVHDKIRGKGNFRKTVAIAKYISKTYGKETLSVGLTVTNNNINDIEKIIDFANEELHAGQIKVVRYTPVVEGTKEYDITDNKKRLELCKMLVRKRDELMKDETYLKFNRLMSFIGGIRNDASEFCAAGRLRLCISPNGIVCPCPILSSHDVKMGDLRKQTLDEIWNGQELKDFRKLSKRNDSKCKECQYFSSCGGGCKANALPYGGSFTTRDTWCYKEIEDEIKDDAIICKNVN